jgi:hypothetical protein
MAQLALPLLVLQHASLPLPPPDECHASRLLAVLLPSVPLLPVAPAQASAWWGQRAAPALWVWWVMLVLWRLLVLPQQWACLQQAPWQRRGQLAVQSLHLLMVPEEHLLLLLPPLLETPAAPLVLLAQAQGLLLLTMVLMVLRVLQVPPAALMLLVQAQHLLPLVPVPPTPLLLLAQLAQTSCLLQGLAA